MESGELEIIFTGDWAPIREFDHIITHDPLKIYGDTLPILRQADYRITNLEAPLAGDKFITKSGAAFTGREEHIQGIYIAQFDAVSLANNHVFDTGINGFNETCKLLKQKYISHFGAGSNLHEAQKPLIIDKNGIKIAVFSLSEGEDNWAATPTTPGVSPWQIDSLAEKITLCKNEQQVNATVVIAHCGLEYIPVPPPYVAKAFEKLANAGADLIVGHHPHVPQGLRVYGHTLAYFSLGNYVFYQPTKLFYRKHGYMVRANFGKSGLITSEIIPYKITDSGINSLTASEKTDFFNMFDKLSEAISSDEKLIDHWNGFLKYYGEQGYFQEIANILTQWHQNPAKGAAMLRNRVATIQHQRHWFDGLTRIVNGTINDASPEASALIHEYFNRYL